MKKSVKTLFLSLTALLLLGLKNISAQSNLSITIAEIRKANETKIRLDSALASGRIVLVELRAYQDSTKAYKDSTAHFKAKSAEFTKKRNRWRGVAISEAALILLTIFKH